ncbi:hypothetical protein JTB14_033494 [Gonioctena quinquepunctata]|nr:hypothetical protein JTB14_033494 [Gonioctena quinquepunctata]
MRIALMDSITATKSQMVASLVNTQVQAALARQKLDFENKFDSHIHEFAKPRQEFEAIRKELSSSKHPTKDYPVLLNVDGWLPETNTTSKSYRPPSKNRQTKVIELDENYKLVNQSSVNNTEPGKMVPKQLENKPNGVLVVNTIIDQPVISQTNDVDMETVINNDDNSLKGIQKNNVEIVPPRQNADNDDWIKPET